MSSSTQLITLSSLARRVYQTSKSMYWLARCKLIATLIASRRVSECLSVRNSDAKY